MHLIKASIAVVAAFATISLAIPVENGIRLAAYVYIRLQNLIRVLS
jgi:hypothetical protein